MQTEQQGPTTDAPTESLISLCRDKKVSRGVQDISQFLVFPNHVYNFSPSGLGHSPMVAPPTCQNSFYQKISHKCLINNSPSICTVAYSLCV